MAASRRRPTRPSALVVVLALTLSVLFGEVARARRAPVTQAPRARQILVVTANLEEAWDARDRADASDLAAFARRVKAVAPHAPDVLLLQEVTRAASKRLVRLLKAKTSRTYAIAASAGRSPADVKKDHVITRETAILINVRTMERVGKRRYVDTTFARRHGSGGGLREVKRNAVALVRERKTGITYPITSVHFHTRRQLRSAELSRRYRKLWVRRVDAFLTKTWPRHRHNAIIGGDFNAHRARWKKGHRLTQRWWRAMENRRFRDSIYEVAPFGGVDYIFTRTRIAGAGVDADYDWRQAAGTSKYYADHQLRWALLGRWRPRLTSRVLSSTAIKLEWDALPSAKRLVIQRRGPGSASWTRVGRVHGRATQMRDLRLEPTTHYRYRVLAWNGAERSDPSPVTSARTPQDRRPPRTPQAPSVRPNRDPLGLKLTWRHTPDRGGSGGVTYEVWRTEAGRETERVTTTNNPRYVDRNFSKRVTIEYFVVAADRAGNRSERSAAATPVPRLGTPRALS